MPIHNAPPELAALRDLRDIFHDIATGVAKWSNRPVSVAATSAAAAMIRHQVEGSEVPECLTRFFLEVAQCAAALSNGEWVIWAMQRYHLELVTAIEALEQVEETTRLLAESCHVTHGESLHEVLRRLSSTWQYVYHHAPHNRALQACATPMMAYGDKQRQLMRSWSTECTVWVYEPTTEDGREFSIRQVLVRVPVWCEDDNYMYMVWRAASAEPVCNPEMWTSAEEGGVVIDMVVDYPPFGTEQAENHAASTLLGTKVRGTVCFVARHAVYPWYWPMRAFVEEQSGTRIVSRLRDLLAGVKLHNGRLGVSTLETLMSAGTRAATRHSKLYG